MKKIWLAQPASTKMTRTKKTSVFLPYSVGTIAAYSWQFAEIKENYKLQDFILFMDDIDEICAKIDDPYLVGFSTYMWNDDFNLSLAKKIKEQHPEAIIVFGGPDVPENSSFLEEYPFIDMLIFGEGEEPFYQLLKTLLSGAGFKSVPSLAYRKDDKIILNPIVTPNNIENYPSPYIEGYFDHIINNPRCKDMQFDVVLETNRGCPYKCLYCSWGTKNAPVRKFSMDRVLGEIKWMREHKTVYCFYADANVGIFDRDEKIIDFIIEQKKKYGYPMVFEIFPAKNNRDVVFRINKKLSEMGLNKGVDLACQSFSPEVLKIIHRQNMSMEEFANQVRLYREANIFTYSDLILGLPGETYESFCRGIFNAYEAGQHYLLVFKCFLLPVSPMADPEIIEKYGIKTIKSDVSLIHTDVGSESSNPSYSNMVVETGTMSQKDWINMNIVAACAHAMQCYGLFKYFAGYVRRALNVPFYDFYMSFIKYLRYESTYTSKILNDVTAPLYTFLESKTSEFYYDKRFGNLYIDIDEAIFVRFAAERDEFYNQTKEFLLRYIKDKELLEDLTLYQKSKITFPFVKEHTEEFRYDWEEYFSDIYSNTPKQPKKTNCAVLFETMFYDDLVLYMRRILWYGKRNGKNFVKSKKISKE